MNEISCESSENNEISQPSRKRLKKNEGEEGCSEDEQEFKGSEMGAFKETPCFSKAEEQHQIPLSQNVPAIETIKDTGSKKSNPEEPPVVEEPSYEDLSAAQPTETPIEVAMGKLEVNNDDSVTNI